MNHRWKNNTCIKCGVQRKRVYYRQLMAIVNHPPWEAYMRVQEWIYFRPGEKPISNRPNCINQSKNNIMDTLQKLKKANSLRCVEAFKHTVESWTPTDWACAVAGETGELCNLVKKYHRGDDDIVIYLDLFCQRMGIDLEEAIQKKFNYTSRKVGSDIFI